MFIENVCICDRRTICLSRFRLPAVRRRVAPLHRHRKPSETNALRVVRYRVARE